MNDTFLDYLNNRIDQLIAENTEHRELTKEATDPDMIVVHNSIAATLWDIKHELENVKDLYRIASIQAQIQSLQNEQDIVQRILTATEKGRLDLIRDALTAEMKRLEKRGKEVEAAYNGEALRQVVNGDAKPMPIE